MAADGTDAVRTARVTALTGSKGIFIASVIAIFILAITAARFATYKPIDFNEAYNLQIAKSIGSHFCYCTRYRPERTFPSDISTNGIVQYVGGLFFALTNNVDSVKAGTAALGTLFLGAVLLALDPWLPILAALLFLVWPLLVLVSIDFVGELWAIGFSLIGLALLHRARFVGSLRDLLRSRAIILSALCFGLAIESKLVAALAIIPLACSVVYQRCPQFTRKERALLAISISATIGLGMLLALLLLVAFSVIHSERWIGTVNIWQSFTGYIFNMVHVGQGQAQPLDASHVGAIISNFDSPIVLALFVVTAAVLLYVNWTYAFFFGITLIWWLHYGGDERHVLVSFYLAIILAGLEARGLIQNFAVKHKTSERVVSFGALGSMAVVVLVAGIASHSGFNAPAQFTPVPHRKNVVQTSQGFYHYSRRLIAELRRQRYIVTSGWWQFPEISIRHDLEFYDRTSPANAALPRDQVALLFDKGNTDSPLTSLQGNCVRVIYAEGPLVLCAVKPDVALNFEPRS